MKIAFFELEKWEKEYIKSRFKGKGYQSIFFDGPLNAKNAEQAKNAEAIACFIYSQLNSEILAQLPRLKFITTMSTGFNHIDVMHCKRTGIKVSNVPSYGENTVAEHTFGLMLSLSRRLIPSIERTKQDNFSLKGLMGFDLKGKKLGVIGTGRIGLHVIRIAQGFEMNVLAYSQEAGRKFNKSLGFQWAEFDDLLRKSDIITLHVPLDESTRHMINIDSVKKMKKGVYLINTARGEIIDTDALLYGLDKGIIAGAGLDVLEGENEIKEEKALLTNGNKKDWETFLQNHLLLKEKNVIITPHTAFYTREALERILDTTIENLKGFMRGKIVNRVV